MKVAIGAAFAALSLVAALPALADQALRPSAQQTAQAPAQSVARTAPAARAEGAMAGHGMTAGQAMPGHMMSGQGMAMDMNQMMSSCPCCRQAMQGKPAGVS